MKDLLQCSGSVALKADNGGYWSVIQRDGHTAIEAAKNNQDFFTKFIVTKVKDSSNVFMTDQYGKYLCAMRRNGVNYIEPGDSLEFYCLFTVIPLRDGKVAFEASNNRFLSRIHRSGVNYIEAISTTIDTYSQFSLESQK